MIQDLVISAAAIILVAFVMQVLYRLYFHPLSHISGPLLGQFSSVFIYTICYLGIEGRVLRHYHTAYDTKVLRVAPNSISISDSSVIRDIYITDGGFKKDSRYKNFNLGDVVSIFSATDTRYRNVRAKAVAPLFSPTKLRAADVIDDCVADFIRQFQEFREASLEQSPGKVKADILDLCARLSIDVLTGYLLNERYGGLHEHADLSIGARQTTKLSVNPFIFSIVAFARFSLLPNRIFRLVYAIYRRIHSDIDAVQAFVRLDKFSRNVVKSATEESSETRMTFQGRLLEAGIPSSEIVEQCKAIIFAGADSVAVMLATIVFHLVQNVDARANLKREIYSLEKAAIFNVESLPYLRAVIKEGLRLGMANPTRFTRIVPAGGFHVGTTYIPAGTVVGCAPYMLHHAPDVFPEPFVFRPERWLKYGEDQGLHRANMDMNMIPFGAGLRACIGKNLAEQQLFKSIIALINSGVLEGARTWQENIDMIEWFNGEIKGHKLEIEWSIEC